MIRQPGQPLRHFAELLINMQIQIQIPAGRAAQQIFHGGGVPVGGVDEAAQQAALPAVGDRAGNGLGFHRILKQGQRDQRHPLQGDAAGIEAGDLLPGVRRVGGKPVDMAAQMGHAIRCRPGQRGGRPTLNICPGPVSAILVHGVDRRQQSGLRRTAAFNGECLVQMGMGFHQAGERQGSRQVPQAGSRLVGWGQCGNPAVAKGQVRQQRLTVGPRRPAVGQRPGRESGAADTGERRARGGERHRQSPHRSKTRPGDFAREQQSVIWSLPAFSSAVSTLSRCSGIPSRTPVIQEPHIPCSQESITSTPACCNT